MSKVPQKLPVLKTLDPKAETELYQAFRRIYEYIDSSIKANQKDIEAKIKSGTISPSDFNSLVGILSQPLAGSSVTDPFLQSILQSFGPQTATAVFAGPIPSFRNLTLADLPAGISGYNRVQDEGVNLTQKAIINFTGAGVSAATVGTTTEVNIPGATSSRSMLDYMGL